MTLTGKINTKLSEVKKNRNKKTFSPSGNQEGTAWGVLRAEPIAFRATPTQETILGQKPAYGLSAIVHKCENIEGWVSRQVDSMYLLRTLN